MPRLSCTMLCRNFTKYQDYAIPYLNLAPHGVTIPRQNSTVPCRHETLHFYTLPLPHCTRLYNTYALLFYTALCFAILYNNYGFFVIQGLKSTTLNRPYPPDPLHCPRPMYSPYRKHRLMAYQSIFLSFLRISIAKKSFLPSLT